MALDPGIYSLTRPTPSPLATLGEIAAYREQQQRLQDQESQRQLNAQKLAQEQKTQAGQQALSQMMATAPGQGQTPPVGQPTGASQTGQPAASGLDWDTFLEKVRTNPATAEQYPQLVKWKTDIDDKAATAKKNVEDAAKAHAEAQKAQADAVNSMSDVFYEHGQQVAKSGYRPEVATLSANVLADQFKGMPGVEGLLGQYRQAIQQGPQALQALIAQQQAGHNARKGVTEPELALQGASGNPEAATAMTTLRPPPAPKELDRWNTFQNDYAQAMGKQNWAQLDPQTRIAGQGAFATASKDPATAANAAAMHEVALALAKQRLTGGSPDKLVKVEHMGSDGRTVIEWLPQSDVAGKTFQKGVSGTTESRLASAQAVNQTGEDMIQKLSDPQFAAKVGPAMGRVNSLRDFVGNPPPEFSELAGEIESYSLANMGVHGMRSAQGAEQIKALLDKKHTPQSLIAAIRGLNSFSTRFMQNEGRGALAATSQGAPAPPPAAPAGWKYVAKPGGGWTAVEDK